MGQDDVAVESSLFLDNDTDGILIAGVAGEDPSNVTYSVADDDLPDADPSNQENMTAAQIALGALADNGGQTDTYALLPGSVAIDAGSNPDNLTTDQRGAGFLRTVGAGTDVGAYEYVPEPATLGFLALGGLMGLTAMRRRRSR
jgi:hypothetical protein